MSFDSVASLQRMQQLQQAQAANSNRLVLKRVNSKLDVGLTIAAFLLFIPTLTITLWLLFIYLFIKELVIKTYTVQNIANGEKFKVYKDDFKKYKKEWKKKERAVINISEMTEKENH